MPSRKRNRPEAYGANEKRPAKRQVQRGGKACAPCQKSKLKCEGGVPCQKCVKRGLACTVSGIDGRSNETRRRALAAKHAELERICGIYTQIFQFLSVSPGAPGADSARIVVGMLSMGKVESATDTIRATSALAMHTDPQIQIPDLGQNEALPSKLKDLRNREEAFGASAWRFVQDLHWCLTQALPRVGQSGVWEEFTSLVRAAGSGKGSQLSDAQMAAIDRYRASLMEGAGLDIASRSPSPQQASAPETQQLPQQQPANPLGMAGELEDFSDIFLLQSATNQVNPQQNGSNVPDLGLQLPNMVGHVDPANEGPAPNLVEHAALTRAQPPINLVGYFPPANEEPAPNLTGWYVPPAYGQPGPFNLGSVGYADPASSNQLAPNFGGNAHPAGYPVSASGQPAGDFDDGSSGEEYWMQFAHLDGSSNTAQPPVVQEHWDVAAAAATPAAPATPATPATPAMPVNLSLDNSGPYFQGSVPLYLEGGELDWQQVGDLGNKNHSEELWQHEFNADSFS
ncbi:hypothetical protein B0H67DRAFT_649458 [Lasiosphaeris hirsuta]|uniref:Zn(2)-C6 fungal-type domain-containing protein n=1 Tax=Lasiosphaeris hirsuta TaxID=260670 RepID=A0AA39ZWW8_9PEZI|nr:hypothetical protein B0H67DRAFT_649458 [Lasiosphaeris hirsuta]